MLSLFLLLGGGTCLPVNDGTAVCMCALHATSLAHAGAGRWGDGGGRTPLWGDGGGANAALARVLAARQGQGGRGFAAAAAAMGINWQSKMLACIARGSLPTISENQVSSYVLRASRSLENRIFFADSQASLCSLGVPSAEQEMKRDALKILRTLGEYMGLVNVEHRDKCQYFHGHLCV